jgi:hypothetical protein
MQSARRELNALAARILKDAPPDEAVALAWPLACGSAVARRTSPISFANGELRVQVPDSGWKAQLEGFSAHYRQKMSELSGVAVERISYEVVRNPISSSRAPSR